MGLEKIKYIGKKVGNGLYKNLSDSTGLLIVASPIQALVDTFGLEVLGLGAMSDAESIGGKIGVAGLTYCGIGWAYGRVRNLSRKTFNITQKSKERIQWVHDWIFTAAFSSTVLATGYFGSNYFTSEENNIPKITTALGISAATQMIRGPLIGYFVDSFQDLLDIKECERSTYPGFIKRLGKKAKKAVAVGAVAVSVGLMALIYAATPDSWSEQEQPLVEPVLEAQLQTDVQPQTEIQSDIRIKSKGLEDRVG